VHAADSGACGDLESVRWALIYALRLATFSAHLVKVMLQAFQALFDSFLRGRELAFDGHSANEQGNGTEKSPSGGLFVWCGSSINSQRQHSA
jgi:hypothetical protein